MYELNTDYEKMYINIVTQMRNYLAEHPVKALVLGVSGGIDSAVVAALCDSTRKMTNIPLIGRSLPIETNKRAELHRADDIGMLFCDSYAVVDLSDGYHDLYGQLDEMVFTHEPLTDLELKISAGNIKARVRMIQLYHLAGINKGMVLSTDNLSELMMGFWTLHGDVGDYGMIQNLWKTEVYGLAQWMADRYRSTGEDAKAEALEACIVATPTDGLGITDSDLEQLGADSYEDVDEIMIDYLGLLSSPQPELAKVWEKHPVVMRHEASHFKRENPVNITREDILK